MTCRVRPAWGRPFQEGVFVEITPRIYTTALLCVFVVAVACDRAEPAPGTLPMEGDRFKQRREAMVQAYVGGSEIEDPLVLAAMRTVPREEFVLPGDEDRAYREMALRIRHGQTVSQPFEVAKMTELLSLQPGERVLEIGTGSGYQAAVLAEITDDVYSIEIIPELAEESGARLAGLGYDSVRSKRADGYFGWEEYAPFDAIVVTAAPDHVPPPLLRQLKDGGNLVVPMGPPGAVQTLWLIEKRGERFNRINKGWVRFVPFVRESGG